MKLVTEENLRDPDDFYAELIELHRGLSDEQSALVNAKLVLLLANHVGDREALREAMRFARQDVAIAGEGAGAASSATAPDEAQGAPSSGVSARDKDQ